MYFFIFLRKGLERSGKTSQRVWKEFAKEGEEGTGTVRGPSTVQRTKVSVEGKGSESCRTQQDTHQGQTVEATSWQLRALTSSLQCRGSEAMTYLICLGKVASEVDNEQEGEARMRQRPRKPWGPE